MPKLSLADRLVCGAIGAVLGGVIGLAFSWLFGVFSLTLGAGRTTVDVERWVFRSALLFGAVGLVFGPAVGTAVGTVIAGIYESTRQIRVISFRKATKREQAIYFKNL